jgi:redox-sensitive bicupin YhaK (pirin superfamily)
MLEVRRSRDRGYADHGWLQTYFTFSYADYYDPEHVDFGPIKVLNQDRIKPGKGYAMQAHEDAEILTYLIDGELDHKDSLGNQTVVRAGGLQRMNAGTGVSHSELNASASQDVHFLHIWVKPQKAGVAPSYEQKHFPPGDKRGMLLLIASPDGEAGSVVIHQDARLYVGLFHQAERADLRVPKNRRAFVHVVRGSIALNETRLNAGDGVKITQPGHVVLQHGREAEVIVFEVPEGIPPPKRKTAVRKAKPEETETPLKSTAGNDPPATRRKATSGK